MHVSNSKCELTLWSEWSLLMGSINISEFVCILCVYVHPLFSLHRCCSLCVVLFSFLWFFFLVGFLLFAPLCVPADAHKDSSLFQFFFFLVRFMIQATNSTFFVSSIPFSSCILIDCPVTLLLSSTLFRFVWLKLIFINDLFLLHPKLKFVIFVSPLFFCLSAFILLTHHIFSHTHTYWILLKYSYSLYFYACGFSTHGMFWFPIERSTWKWYRLW